MRTPPLRQGLAALAATALIAGSCAAPAVAAVDGTGIVINEAYLSGGSANAPFQDKFVELYNPTAADVDLDGWSLQYRAAGSTGAATAYPLSGSIPAGGHFLVSGGSNGATGGELPAADLATGLNPSGTTGTIILANTTERLTLPAGSTTGHESVVDLLGYGGSNTFETAVAPAPSANNVPRSINRADGVDTDDNSADFAVLEAITPTNSAGEAPVEPEPEPEPEPGPDPELVEIAAIQGEGDATPLAGQRVTTRGVVTAAFPDGGFDGYYLQTPGTGGEGGEAASHGIFVHSPETVGDVEVGDHVEVTGTAGEYYGLTQLSVTAGGATVLDEPAEAVKPLTAAWPADDAGRERYEGMLWDPQGSWTVADNYALNNYGEITLAHGESTLVPGLRTLAQPTDVARPGSTRAAEVEAENKARSVVLDDGSSLNFLGSTANQSVPLPYLTASTPVRVGAAVAFSGPVVLDYRFEAWKFQPQTRITGANAAAQPVAFAGDRPAAPAAVGGTLKLAAFNVLNYFTTTGSELTGCTYYNDRAGNPVTVRGGCDARGAADPANLERQQAKIVAALNGLGADVVALQEIENSAAFGKDRDAALAALTSALNAAAGAGTWDYVRSPAAVPTDEDVIRTAFIYRAAAAEPVGESAILDGDPAFSNAREPLAQAFRPAGGDAGGTFVAVVNHFKSKGSAPGDGSANDDSGDGQGAWNADRVRQAEAVVDFAGQVAEEAGTDKVFLAGDFNAYTHEDPMQVFYEAGYVDQGAKTGKQTYLFGARVGSLDHILASPAADAAVTGADIWNINAVEPIALEYSRYNYNATNLHEASAYRASDHDPLVVGLDLGGAAAGIPVSIASLNDYHGQVDADNGSTKLAATVEQWREDRGVDSTLLTSAGDNIGASQFASLLQQDEPALEILNALGVAVTTVGNHEFDKGWPDLRDRVSGIADFNHLAANVLGPDGQPVLPASEVFEVNGVKVAVVGAVTADLPTLVSPAGLEGLTVTDPVAAVNAEIERLPQDVDVVVASYHEGAQPADSLEAAKAGSGIFKRIVEETSPEADAIFNGHSHQLYNYTAANGDSERPVMQAASAGGHLAVADFTVDPETREVTFVGAENLPVDADADVDALAGRYPVVAAVKEIEDRANAEAEVLGAAKVGEVTASITTDYAPDFAGNAGGNRAKESSLGNLLATVLRDSVSTLTPQQAQIGVMNAGGIRDELFFDKSGRAPGAPAKDVPGDISYKELNNVFPFGNTLFSLKLTGAEVWELLEQQWRIVDGTESRLALGLTDNLDYTFDTELPVGERVTGVWFEGEPLDLEAEYSIGTLNFLAGGGDSFTALTGGTERIDTGYSDMEALVDFVERESPLSPDFSKRGVEVSGAPGLIEPGGEYSFEVRDVDLGSDGAPVSDELVLEYVPGGSAETPSAAGVGVGLGGGGIGASVGLRAAVAAPPGGEIGTFEVVDGVAVVSFTAPTGLDGGAFVLHTPAGDTVQLPSAVATASDVPSDDGDDDGAGGDGGTDDGSGTGNGNGNGPGSGSDDGDGGSALGPGFGQGGTGGLAATGSEGLLPLGIGALMLAGLGLAFVLRSRRREAALHAEAPDSTPPMR
ncbi:ExeM/NucH family extracellular endonuclease [Zafaria sp. Z1313]|uniref:ExeM/NucH family extracellular endonuclease n=1 Tax=unclassified Zafaria TaxID=2828765 RepID=UPI002E75F17E|nr:ExeM/NucH family extracellular endonuclease [Zafaria sp. J156]MEE1622047.1 ExeM/NucH family extracellular endonuclease [Zafaria sp. J156]